MLKSILSATALAGSALFCGYTGWNLADHNDAMSHPVQWESLHGITIEKTSDYVHETVAAFDEWGITATIEEQGAVKVHAYDPARERVGGEAQPEINDDRWITGCTIGVSGAMVAEMPELLEPTLIHEVGHCLGMKHDHTGYPSIMYFDMGGWETGLFSFEMTEHDLNALARFYGLPESRDPQAPVYAAE